MKRLWLRRDDSERCAILIMATVGVILAIIGAALAVDLGRIAQERRNDQRVADLAALDAARDLGNADARAKASADRNKFPWAKPGYSLTTAVGSLDANRVFHAGVGSTAVEVTVKSPIKNTFVSGSRTITTRAVATVQNEGMFSIGSSLANLDPSKSVLDQVMGRWVQASGPVNIVSYQGLASTNVNLGVLQQQLVTAGLDVGTVDKLMNTSISYRQLLQATASALGPGNPAVAADLNGLALAANSTMMVKLGEMMNIAQGSEDAALAADFNVFRLVTGSAAVANGTNTVTIPSMTVSIPNVGSLAVALKVIELPKTYIGPVSAPTPHAQTSQLELTVTPTFNINLAAARITGALPITATAAKAIGNLTAVDCGAKSITVDATTGAFTESVSTTLDIALTLPPTGPMHVLDVDVTANGGPSGPTPVTFNYPAGFGAPGQHVGSTTAGLGTLATADSSNPIVRTLVNTVVLPALRPALDAIDTQVIRPILKAAGADVGAADVVAHPLGPDGVRCDGVTLAV